MKIYKYVCFDSKKEEFKNFLTNFIEKKGYKYKIIYKNKINPIQSILKILENKIEATKFKFIFFNHISDIIKLFGKFELLQFNELRFSELEI